LLDDRSGSCKTTFLTNQVVLGLLLFIINNDYLFVVL
jgi:hypothetical protein